MTYSISWALFALVLLVVGITRKARAVRYSSLGLLSITVLKLLLHDLASLHQLRYLDATLKETLRLRPIIPIVAREV